jgi:hypothetical protein
MRNGKSTRNEKNGDKSEACPDAVKYSVYVNAGSIGELIRRRAIIWTRKQQPNSRV